MFIRFLLFLFVFFNYSTYTHADEKQSIINKLLEINNFTFSFEQTTQKKVETGTCFLVFDNKLKCIYLNKNQKEIIVNNKTLVVLQKRYNKIYFYPVSKSLFVKILKKSNLISLVKGSNLEINTNIELIYFDKKGKKITFLFEKENFELIGWKVEDELHNKIHFALKIQKINTEIDNSFFKIPAGN